MGLASQAAAWTAAVSGGPAAVGQAAEAARVPWSAEAAVGRLDLAVVLAAEAPAAGVQDGHTRRGDAVAAPARACQW
ncbi:hypothetical protein [Mycolicibacterium peregrinum]|nr:hypothetical protein [Mycolicibacterium peregrinum]